MNPLTRSPYHFGPAYSGGFLLLYGTYEDYEIRFLNNGGVFVKDIREFSLWDEREHFLPGVKFINFKAKYYTGGMSEVISADKMPYHTKVVHDVDFGNDNTVTIPRSALLETAQDYHGYAVDVANISIGDGGEASFDANGDIVFTCNGDDSYRKYFLFTVKNSLGYENALELPVYLREPHHPTDAKFFDQWPLFDTRTPQIWDDYTGKGSKVLVFDAGFLEHRDIDMNIMEPTYFVGSGDGFTEHGLSVAGAIGANRDGNDLVGIAYDSDLSYASYSNSGETFSTFPDVTQFDVVNNSWGGIDNLFWLYKTDQEDSDRNAIENAVIFGRNGLGTNIVFASGNSHKYGSDGNGKRFADDKYVISVGGYNRDADDPTFGYDLQHEDIFSKSPNVLVSAPANCYPVLSITNVGYHGHTLSYDPCVEKVAGTSLATPTVSGIISLMLEANPDLGWRDVQDILAYSALPNFDYYNIFTNTATNSNGGGLVFNAADGFGHVDTYGAVRLAESWDHQNTSASCKYLDYNLRHNKENYLKCDPVYRVDFEVKQDIEIERVSLNLSFSELSSEQISAYEVRLLSPEDKDGNRTVVKMIDHPGIHDETMDFKMYPEDYMFNTSIYSQHFKGASSKGTWTIEFEKDESVITPPYLTRLNLFGDHPMLFGASVGMYGKDYTSSEMIYTDAFNSNKLHEIKPYPNHQDNSHYKHSKHIKTSPESSKHNDDTADSSRFTLSSDFDAINTTAVTSDVLIDLTGEQKCFIAGQEVVLESPDTISHVKTGDGNDLIIGNIHDNHFLLSRGNNVLHLGDGDNTISLLNPSWHGLGTTKIYDFSIGSDHITLPRDFDISSIYYEVKSVSSKEVLEDIWSDLDEEFIQQILQDNKDALAQEFDVLSLHIGKAELELYDVDHFDIDIFSELA